MRAPGGGAAAGRGAGGAGKLLWRAADGYIFQTIYGIIRVPCAPLMRSPVHKYHSSYFDVLQPERWHVWLLNSDRYTSQIVMTFS